MPEDWGVPLAVSGMLLAMLVMASLLGRYQAHQAYVRGALRRLETRINAISESLDALHGIPLSRELRVALRAEILARQQAIRRLHKRLPGVADRIQSAERALQAEGAPAPGPVGPIDSEQTFRRMLRAIDSLLDALTHADGLTPIPRDVRLIFCRELGERRAEAMARFHLVRARHLEGEGNTTKARAHLATLLQVLRQRGPETQFVRELYSEADAALTELTRRQLGIGGADEVTRASRSR